MMARMIHEHTDDGKRTILLTKHFGHLENIILLRVQLFKAIKWLLAFRILLLK